MKKLSVLLLSCLAAFALAATGCSSDPDTSPVVPEIKASGTTVVASAGEGKFAYTVDNPVQGQTLVAKSQVDWLHDLVVNETEVRFQVDENPGESSRDAKVVLSYAGAADLEVTVTQTSAAESILINPKSLSFAYTGGTEKVTVTCGGEWTLELPEGADWVTADKTQGTGNGEVVFTVSGTNEDEAERTAVFTFVRGEVRIPLTVVQNPEGKLLIDETSQHFLVAGEGEEVTVKLKTNIEPVEAVIPEDADWITEVTTRTMIEKEFKLAVAANTTGAVRSATITFKNADAAEQVVVMQAAAMEYPEDVASVIKDKYLKKYVLENFSANGETLTKEEALAVTNMVLKGSDMESIEGVEYFQFLETVDFSNSPRLTKTDFSKNTMLKSITMGWCNYLKTVDISGCSKLEELMFSYSPRLTKLDVSNNPQLRSLTASSCKFSTAPDLKNNTKLKKLSLDQNPFATIDVSANTELTSLSLGSTSFVKLDVTMLAKLENLSVSGGISKLDVTQNAELTSLNISNSQIASIDLTHCPKLREFRGQNGVFRELDFSKNLMLILADVYMSGLNKVILTEGQTIDSTMGISTDMIEYIPYESPENLVANAEDAAYKQYLLDNFDTDKDGKLSAAEAQAITEINIKGLGITSIDGVDYYNFTGVKKFDCSDNELTDVTAALNFFTALEEFYGSNNEIVSLNFIKNKNIRIVEANDNALTALGSISSSNIESVEARNNALTSFTLQYSKMKKLDLSHNQLTNCNFHTAEYIVDLDLSYNQLTSVTLWPSRLLENLNMSNNPLTSISTWGSTGYGYSLRTLDLSNTALTSLDVSGNSALTVLNVTGCVDLPEVFVGTLDVDKMDIKNDAATKIVRTSLLETMTDENFRKFIVETYGSNGDLSFEQAAAIVDLELTEAEAPGVKSLAGINNFPNLKTLTVSGLESLGATDLSQNRNLEKIDLRLQNGLESLSVRNLDRLTSIYVERTSTAAGNEEAEVNFVRLELEGCTAMKELSLISCRKMVAISLEKCTELEALNLRDSFVGVWLGDEGGENEVSVNISYCPKLIDPVKFIPSNGIKQFYATTAQVEALADYFKTEYGWTGGWKTN